MNRGLLGGLFLVAGGAVYLWGMAMRNGTSVSTEAANLASKAGRMLSRGLRNNNPGNVRISSAPWVGKITPNTDGAFEQFDTPENGIRVIAKVLRSYQARGLQTIAQIIATYAPNSENNTAAYVAAVEKASGINRNVPLRFPADYHGVIAAIIKHENGINPYTAETIAAGIARA